MYSSTLLLSKPKCKLIYKNVYYKLNIYYIKQYSTQNCTRNRIVCLVFMRAIMTEFQKLNKNSNLTIEGTCRQARRRGGSRGSNEPP